MFDDNVCYVVKMVKVKVVCDCMMQDRQGEKGLIIVYIGKGKGKFLVGFGMILCCIVYDMFCVVVQFIKGVWDIGEWCLLIMYFGGLCQFYVMGEGFIWDMQDWQCDIVVVWVGWDKVKILICDFVICMVLLDEINIVLCYDYLDVVEVVVFLWDEKLLMIYVVLIGCNVKFELIEIVDLVIEMEVLKYFFCDGIKVQVGVEF